MTERLLDLVDQCAGLMLITDQAGVVVYVNRAVEQKYGFAYGEVIGKRPGAVWGGAMPKSFYQELWKQIAIRKQPFMADIENQPKHSTAVTERIHIFPIVDRNQQVRYFVELSLPPTATAIATAQFRQEALQLFQQADEFENHFLEWAIGWLSDHTQQINLPVAALPEFLETELIHPMRQRLHLRYEDYSLVAAAQSNNEDFSHLYTKYYKAVFSYVKQHTNFNTDVAEVITQDVFMHAFAHLATFQLSNASYKTYLLTIAHNCVINYYRSVPPDSLHSAHTIPNQHEVMEHIELQLDIDQLLKNLPPLEQTIIQYKYQAGLSIRDIAKLVDKSENAVKLILSRSRKKLRQYKGSF